MDPSSTVESLACDGAARRAQQVGRGQTVSRAPGLGIAHRLWIVVALAVTGGNLGRASDYAEEVRRDRTGSTYRSELSTDFFLQLIDMGLATCRSETVQGNAEGESP